MLASSDEKIDEWTSQFLSSGVKRESLTEFFPRTNRVYWKHPVAAVALAGPEAVLTADHTENNVRTMSFRVTSPRHAPVISIYAPPETVMDAGIDGQRAVRAPSATPINNWIVRDPGH